MAPMAENLPMALYVLVHTGPQHQNYFVDSGRKEMHGIGCARYWSGLSLWVVASVFGLPSTLTAQPVPMTIEDFHLSGTQIGDVSPEVIMTSDNCRVCHGDYDPANEPYNTWTGSLMGQAGRDPLFFAQMTNANQDVANVGYFCMRCHVPMSFVTGHAYQPDGSTIDSVDEDGVTCHHCHSMVDPIYKAGISPPQDASILAALTEPPQHYGNSMFVLDPTGLRRGPYSDAAASHDFVESSFHRTGEFCGTCHDVGNVAVTRQPDGTYRYNGIDEPTPTEDLRFQFPLERTYTEWKLSAFAQGGVDMNGRFGGTGSTVVSTCQDCHMPKAIGRGCYFGPERSDLARHEFAGASAWVLEIIAAYYRDDPAVDVGAVAEGRQRAIDMVQRAASLQLAQQWAGLNVRVINETGHKLPTGHIEGRRVWVNVKLLNDMDQVVREYGHYDAAEAELDEATTTVYEMHVGLSDEAALATGLPGGVTTHMALADTIEKDKRIPPRGFNNATYESGGAPAIGIAYADGQYWHDAAFWIPDGAVRADVTVYYQTVTRHYIEALRDGNITDHWGNTLYDLWLNSDRGAPIPITIQSLVLVPFTRGDFDNDGLVGESDVCGFEACFNRPMTPPCSLADFNGDSSVDCQDWQQFAATWDGPGEIPASAVCTQTIPTVSEWGLVILTLMLVTMAKVTFSLQIMDRNQWCGERG